MRIARSPMGSRRVRHTHRSNRRNTDSEKALVRTQAIDAHALRSPHVGGYARRENCPPARNTHSSQTLVNTGVLWEVS